VRDPELRAALTPSYPLGCKRTVISDDFYPALQLPHVSLETGAIVRVERGAVVVAGGGGREVRHALDVLVLATGFDVVASIDSLAVTGRAGVTMREAWAARGGPEAYRGVLAHGFPNLFMMMGPNTGLGHSSMISMIEAQARFTAEVVVTALERELRAVDVRAHASTAYNVALQDALRACVWGGCNSWYNLQGAKNVVLWPFTVARYHWLMRSVKWDDLALAR
jgi:cation diffusion facilitator CzcD-associated flavoprotein CzcO